MPCGLRFWRRKAKKKSRDVESGPPADPPNDPIANSSTLAPTEPADALTPRQQAELMGGGGGNRERRDEADGKLDSALTATGVVLELVVEAADLAPFGILKTAASLSLKIVEMCQAVKENDSQYRILADDTTQFIAVIWRSYRRSSSPEAWLTPDLKQVVQELVRTLTDINEFVKEKQTRGTFIKTLASTSDVSQLKGYRDRIDTAFKRFQVSSHFTEVELINDIKSLLSNGIVVGPSGERVLGPQDEARLKVVYDTAAPNAILNAGGRADEVRCHPGTREEVLDKSEAWMDPPTDQQINNSRDGIFWLSGPAGAGKSAIVQTLAERRLEKGLPMANFFFFRNDTTRSNAGPLVATILTQLFDLYPDLKVLISAVLREKPNIFRQSLHNQFQHLIDIPIRSLRAANPSLFQQPIVLLIDGLDECSSDANHEQQTLLKVLHNLASRDGSTFLVFVASRAEPHLIMTFNQVGSSAASIFLCEDYHPEDDIRLFVTERLAEIKTSHHLGPKLARSWPTDDQIDLIVAKSSGQFIYAATVIRFISGLSSSPAFSLDIVHRLRPVSRTSPFAELDALYTHILSQVSDWKSVKDVLTASLLDSDQPLYLFLCPLGYEGSDIPSFVSDVTAIVKLKDAVGVEISYPSVVDFPGILEFYHASFTDFLCDKTRSGNYYIDVQEFCDTWTPDFIRCIRDNNSLEACRVVMEQVSGPSLSITEALLSFPTLEFQFVSSGLISRVAPVYFMGKTLRNYCRKDDQLYKQLVQLWIAWFHKNGTIFEEDSDTTDSFFGYQQSIKAQLEPGVWEEIIRSSEAEKESQRRRWRRRF